jgi:hypothetical protein
MKKTLLKILFIPLLFSGCTYTKLDNSYDNPHKYYVIDAHSDVPDAHFRTYEEAATYQKEFAEYHEYVIVKMEGKYNVYNMEPIRK